MNYVDEVLSVTGKVGFYGARFTGGKESTCSEAVRNVGASSAVSATTKGTRRKLGFGRVTREFSCDK